jgi:exopolysaccharide production protein ExoY
MYRMDSDALDAVKAAARHVPEESVWLPPRDKWGLGVKRGIDIFAALVFFTVFLPLYVAVAIGVRWSSHGPALYSQSRVGQHGRTFRFYKFRSMVVDSDEVLTSFLDSDSSAKSEWDQYQKLTNDPRITRFGRFIRKTSLDELPQFWNVLKGEMSLVGPRPCMPGQERFYGRHWATYCALKPGLTGLWQVSGRNKLTYEQRVRLDARYAKEWSLWLDAKILLKTVKVVLTNDGSK